MQWSAGWFFLGASAGLFIGTLLSFLLGGPAWPYLSILGIVSLAVSLTLLLRSGADKPPAEA